MKKIASGVAVLCLTFAVSSCAGFMHLFGGDKKDAPDKKQAVAGAVDKSINTIDKDKK